MGDFTQYLQAYSVATQYFTLYVTEYTFGRYFISYILQVISWEEHLGIFE